MLGESELRERFGFHKASIEGANATMPKHSELRKLFLRWAMELDMLLPDGREKDIALQRLEDASMWAHKSVAKGGVLIPEEPIGLMWQTPKDRFDVLRSKFFSTHAIDPTSKRLSDFEIAKFCRSEGSLSLSDFEFLFGHLL